MRSTLTPLAATLTGAALMVTLAACSSDSPKHAASSSSSSSTQALQPGVQGPGSGDSSSATPSPTNTTPDVDAAPNLDGKDQGKVATAFITQRENNLSADRATDAAWVQAAKPYITDSMYQSLGGSDAGKLTQQLVVNKKADLHVKVTTHCAIDPEGRLTDPNQSIVQCSISDTFVDSKGNLMPPNKVPAGMIGGARPGVMYAMKKVDGSWKVDQDQTGQGG